MKSFLIKNKIKIKEFFSNYSKGFNITELLIVIFIIAVLSSVFLMNYRSFGENYALERSAYKLAQDIRRVSEMAMASRQFEDNAGNPIEVDGYGIIFYNDQKTFYDLFYYFDSASPKTFKICEENSPIDIKQTFETIELEKGVIISDLLNDKNYCINFVPPAPNVLLLDGDNSDIGESIIIELKLENDSSKIKTITINNTGMISIQ